MYTLVEAKSKLERKS